MDGLLSTGPTPSLLLSCNTLYPIWWCTSKRPLFLINILHFRNWLSPLKQVVKRVGTEVDFANYCRKVDSDLGLPVYLGFMASQQQCQHPGKEEEHRKDQELDVDCLRTETDQLSKLAQDNLN